MTPDAAIASVATAQHALLARRQALDVGFTRRMIDVRLGRGRWENPRPNVYSIAGAPPTERQQVMAVCLSADVAASHLTAARLWGLDLPPPEEIEVVGPHTRLPGVRSHQSQTLVTRDLVHLGAIPLTSPARTLVDSSARVSASRLGLIVDDALRRRHVTLRALRECHERVDTGPGRRPTVAMREVLAARAGECDAGDSVPEPELLRALAQAGLPAPVLGHRVRVGGRAYRIDLAWPEWKLGLEWDSWQFHRWYSAFHGDRQRLRRLIAAGWTIIPVTSKTAFGDLVSDLWAVISRCATA